MQVIINKISPPPKCHVSQKIKIASQTTEFYLQAEFVMESIYVSVYAFILTTINIKYF